MPRDASDFISDDQTEAALLLIDDRNLTVHTYNEALARQIMARLPGHADLLRSLLGRMQPGQP